jgi:hypothetical protein
VACLWCSGSFPWRAVAILIELKMLPDENGLHPSISLRVLLEASEAEMDRVIDFRRHADECRQLARRSRSVDERAMLLDMAASWDTLAANRQRLIERKSAP